MPACSKPSPPCCPESAPCKNIQQAASLMHLECVKHFWGLRDESDLQEIKMLKSAVFLALRHKDTGTLEFLLSNHCPWEQRLGQWPFPVDNSWAEWRDTCQIALTYKMADLDRAVDMLRWALKSCDWDFLKKAQEHGYDVGNQANIHFANQPDVPALKAFLAQDAFSTVNLTWLTPQFALERNDQALLELAHQLQGTHDLSVAAAEEGNMKPTPPRCPSGVPCNDILVAAMRKHLGCVKQFWGLRNESSLQEKEMLKEAVFSALMNRDTRTLEFLLSNHCPWEQRLARWPFPVDESWAEWRDTCQIALRYKMPDLDRAVDMLRWALTCCDWDFLKTAQEHGYDVGNQANIHFANQPNVQALKEFLAQDAFSTVNLTWLTPKFAVERNDPALLEFVIQLQRTQLLQLMR